MEIDNLNVRLDADISGFRRGLAEASALLGSAGARLSGHAEETQAALGNLGEGLEEQAVRIGETLEGVARSLSNSFARAFDRILRDGKADIGGLIAGLGRDLARLGINAIFGGIGKQASGLLGSLIGRAAGGPVGAGTAYLVGERGPELFVPSSSGSIAPVQARASAPQITFNVHTQDARSFLQSESQIMSMLGRAMVRGQRFRSP